MTIVELVTVIVLIGIISLIAIPRFFNRTPFEESGYFQTTLSAVRYAQKLALTSGCDIRVTINNAGFQLDQWNNGTACDAGLGGSALSPVTRPGSSDTFAEAPPAGVTISLPYLTIYFDGVGRPHYAGGALLTSPEDVDIGGRTLTIENETGYTRCTTGCS